MGPANWRFVLGTTTSLRRTQTKQTFQLPASCCMKTMTLGLLRMIFARLSLRVKPTYPVMLLELSACLQRARSMNLEQNAVFQAGTLKEEQEELQQFFRRSRSLLLAMKTVVLVMVWILLQTP